MAQLYGAAHDWWVVGQNHGMDARPHAEQFVVKRMSDAWRW